MAGSVTELAQSAVGVVPYMWARPQNPGISIARLEKSGADCSGLLMWAYWHAGARRLNPANHWTVAQYHTLKRIPVENAQPGDAIFYSYKNNGHWPPDHVAINLGGGQLVEAPEPGLMVRTRAWSPTDQYVMRHAGQFPGNHGTTTGGGSGGVTRINGPLKKNGLPNPGPGNWRGVSGQHISDPPYGYHLGIWSPAMVKFANAQNMANPPKITATTEKRIRAWLKSAGYDISGMSPDAAGAMSGYLLFLFDQSGTGGPSNRTPSSGGVKSGLGINAGSWLSELGTFLGDLLDPHTWLRIFEFAVGALLLGIGLAHLTGADNAVSKLAGRVNPV